MCNYPVLYPLIVSWNGIFDVSRSHLYLHYGWFSFGKLWKSITGGWRKCRWTILLVTASKWMFFPKKVDYGQRVQKFRRARTRAWWEILKGQGASSYGSHLNLWTIHDSSCSKPSSNLGWQWILIWHTVLHGEIIHLNGRCCIIRNWWEPQAKAGRSPKHSLEVWIWRMFAVLLPLQAADWGYPQPLFPYHAASSASPGNYHVNKWELGKVDQVQWMTELHGFMFVGGQTFDPTKPPNVPGTAAENDATFGKSSLTPIANRLANHWRRDRNLSQSSTGNHLGDPKASRSWPIICAIFIQVWGINFGHTQRISGIGNQTWRWKSNKCSMGTCSHCHVKFSDGTRYHIYIYEWWIERSFNLTQHFRISSQFGSIWASVDLYTIRYNCFGNMCVYIYIWGMNKNKCRLL